MTDVDYEALDPNIRETVRWLQDHGFNTTDSGDGASKRDLIETGDALDFPHVFMACDPSILLSEANRLCDRLRSRLPEDVGHIEASYNPEDGVGIIALYNVTDTMLLEAIN